MQKLEKNDLLVSYNFNRLYQNAQADNDSTSIETTYPFKICFFNSEISQTLEFDFSAYSDEKKFLPLIKKKRLEKTNGSRNGIFVDTVYSVDIVETVKSSGVILEVFEGGLCLNMKHNPYTEFVNDVAARRDWYKKQGKNLFQTPAKKVANSVYGGKIRRDVND